MQRQFLFLACSALIAACTHQVELTSTDGASVYETEVRKIDRRVGVYISPEFRAETRSETAFGDEWVFPVGAASAREIEKAAVVLFTEAVPVDSPAPGGMLPGLDAVLVPQLEDLVIDLPVLKTSTHRASVTYRFTLQDHAGTPVASWVVRGEGESLGGLTFSYTKWPSEAASRAIEDAMRLFVEGGADEPEIRQWLSHTAPAVTG